jgi:dihydrofolate reductase/thymidylate synthase
MFSLIVARDAAGGIGYNGQIPWHYPTDLKLFKTLTTDPTQQNAVVMGYNTWRSLRRPLSGRINIVISATHYEAASKQAAVMLKAELAAATVPAHVEVYKSPNDFLRSACADIHYWIIGGRQIYEWFLANHLVTAIYDTQIASKYTCDTILDLDSIYNSSNWVAPICPPDAVRAFNSANEPELYLRYTLHHGNRDEQQILDTIRDILDNGEMRQERTGTGTLSIFGGQLRFDLSSFPLMTARPHSFRMIFEELMWILRGQRDVGILEKKNIPIWTPNSTQEFIDRQGLDIPLSAGDIGESYGHNMRNYGGGDDRASNRGGGNRAGYDQLANALHLLQNNPTSRRIIINLWNPAGVKRAALPPCLCWYQFYVRNKGGKRWLDCQAMNRSSDIVVAGGWNVATAALLTYILAAACGMEPGVLTWIYGDAHIYLNNVEAAKELVTRTPRLYPKLFVLRKLQTVADIESLEFGDFKLVNYAPIKPQIKLAMNA